MQRRALLTLIAITAWAWAEETAKAPIAANPKVEIRGKIEKVRITPGAGMPSIEVSTADGVRQVTLGAMHYLMERNFQPKAGDQVIVKGYRLNDTIVASHVELPGTKISLPLRDENGYPLWRMGRHHGSPHHGGHQ